MAIKQNPRMWTQPFFDQYKELCTDFRKNFNKPYFRYIGIASSSKYNRIIIVAVDDPKFYQSLTDLPHFYNGFRLIVTRLSTFNKKCNVEQMRADGLVNSLVKSNVTDIRMRVLQTETFERKNSNFYQDFTVMVQSFKIK